MLFLGCLFRKENEKEILELSNVGLSNAVNTFQWNLINGFNTMIPVDIINVLPVGTYPKNYKRIFLKTQKWHSEKNRNNLEVGSVNLPFVKQFMRYKRTKNEIKSRIKESKIDDIIIYSTYLPFLKAVYKLERDINITLIVTDLPEFYDLNKVGLVRKILRKINNYFVYKYLKRIDIFVLLTEEMKTPLKVGNRPYTVVEGIVDSKNISRDIFYKNESNKKIIFYAGTLHYQFGIKMLLQAFTKIDYENYELWICGTGEAESEIKRLSQQDKRIKFLGYLTKQEVNKLQNEATVLINPRNNEGEYTKYSFPSKTMEYMLTGKPVIMYKLDGLPNEYDDYLYYIDGDSPEYISSKVIEVCEKSEEERNDFGMKARNFVLNNKNNIVQCKKILKLLDEKE